jgi:hypothetical protein
MSLPAAIPAGAATSGPLVITTSYDTAFAGYITGGDWRFRFVAADVPMAKCLPRAGGTADNNAVASIALTSNIAGQAAHIDLSCDGGAGSVRYGATASSDLPFALSPSVGDVLRISVFRNRAAGQGEFVATNTATGRTQKVTLSVPGVIYRHAALGATFENPAGVALPTTKVRLWVFRNIAITSYSGNHGTICGPWPTDKFIATTTGTASGTVLMFPSNPSNSCLNFGAWLKGA